MSAYINTFVPVGNTAMNYSLTNVIRRDFNPVGVLEVISTGGSQT